MSRILLGVSGGIAAYKALELARLATRAGHGVRVLMTPAATRFVGPVSFEAIVGAPVLIDEFERDPMRGAFPGEPAPDHDPIGHLALAEACDAYLVAPASANTLAKLAGGHADGMLTTSFLACSAPRLLAPAMNDRMYRDPATADNLRTLRRRGVTVIEPDSGELASRGEQGIGRLPDPARLLDEIERVIGGRAGPWEGLRVLVTTGGTREPIDSVRYIGNRSSGRMGLAMARCALDRGAEVTLIAANVPTPAPAAIRRVDVSTAAELARATGEQFDSCDVLVMAAAVADFRPASPQTSKLEREGSGGIVLELDATDDVLAGLAERRGPGQILVGFAAEHGGELVERARAKLRRKGLDAIVVNDVSDPEIGFDSALNEVIVVDADDELAIPRAGKDEVAAAICKRIDGMRSRQGLPQAESG